MKNQGGRRRFEEDHVDRACHAWAYQWVQAFAQAPEPGQMIGNLGCTLGRVHELHDGASSSTQRNPQRFPEVFLGEALFVAIALTGMRDITRRMIWFHYVDRWFAWNDKRKQWERKGRPTKQQIMAHRMGLGLSDYYVVRNTAKSCVDCVLTLDTKDLARLTPTSRQSAQVV